VAVGVSEKTVSASETVPVREEEEEEEEVTGRVPARITAVLDSETDPTCLPSQQREQHADAEDAGAGADGRIDGAQGDCCEKEDSQLVRICGMVEGSFNVTLPRGALVDELKVAIGEARGIANARHAVAVFVAGEYDPLAGSLPVAAYMADAAVSELFMLVTTCNDRAILMELFTANDGANWSDQKAANWGSDAALHDWAGVRADATGNVTSIASFSNKKITGCSRCIHSILSI
jgi:hypothetical protein